jgi:hypothetical protein
LENFAPKAMSFINVWTGYVCGDSGVVLKTTNGGLTFVNNYSNNIPETFSLSQNFPNPFNPSTKIKFDIPPLNLPLSGGDRDGVILIVYDILGREVATLVNQKLTPGTYEINWDAANFPSGIYFYSLLSGDFTETKKMVLVK